MLPLRYRDRPTAPGAGDAPDVLVSALSAVEDVGRIHELIERPARDDLGSRNRLMNVWHRPARGLDHAHVEPAWINLQHQQRRIGGKIQARALRDLTHEATMHKA